MNDSDLLAKEQELLDQLQQSLDTSKPIMEAIKPGLAPLLQSFKDTLYRLRNDRDVTDSAYTVRIGNAFDTLAEIDKRINILEAAMYRKKLEEAGSVDQYLHSL